MEASRLVTLNLRAQRAWQEALDISARAQALRETRTEVSRKELLTASPFARVYARLGTMPVIEQAKGVLMAQQGCTADEAFDLLRRASQRSNVPVRDLAEKIVNARQHSTGQAPV